MQKESDHTISLYTETEVIETTAQHPFFVNNAWKDASELEPGDKIQTKDKQEVEIKSTQFNYEPKKVFNFTVGNWHTYFVGMLMLLVHNAKRCLSEMFQSLTGKSLNWIKKQKPKGWKTVASDNGKGWKWLDKNGVERLRFQRPQKGAVKWTREKNGYFRWMNEAGQHLDEAGKVVPKDAIDFMERTHIPYNGL
jgi:intein/homing endonuclease